MAFELDIKDESNLEENNKKYLDEDEAADEAIKKNIIVAYY